LRVCRRRDVPLLVNDRVDVALAAGADGVHLPGDSFRVAEARALLGERALIGVSTHAPEEVAAAAAEGADFAVFGPVFETPSKAAYGAPQGLERLGAAVRAASLPVLAIGGMTPERATAARRIGAAGAAVVSAILAAPDPAAAAREFVVARPPGKP
jgi:thiamine-phosphate pyrophosphorylase